MAIICSDTKLCDIVITEPSCITVLNRFNIFLGLGDKTVNDICAEKDLNLDFFIAILNTYLNEDYMLEDALMSSNINDIIEYFRKTNEYYQGLLIPNIERHFDVLVMKSSSGKNNLMLLRKFFDEVKHELNTRIANDNELFSKLSTVNGIHEENDFIEDKLSDLINMFIIHLKGEYDINLCQAVITSFISFQKDIRQNNRIRYRILIPMLCKL